VLDEDVDGQMRVDLAATSGPRATAGSFAARSRAARAAARRADVAAAARASASPSESQPLYHGVVQRGRYAIAEASGAVLAVAPMHWTAGCPVLEADRTSARGIAWRQRSYLDPMSGRALYVEAVPVDAPRSFTTAPTRWADA
jgi:N-methylhydantoinase B